MLLKGFTIHVNRNLFHRLGELECLVRTIELCGFILFPHICLNGSPHSGEDEVIHAKQRADARDTISVMYSRPLGSAFTSR